MSCNGSGGTISHKQGIGTRGREVFGVILHIQYGGEIMGSGVTSGHT